MVSNVKTKIIDACDSAQDVAANIKVGPTEKRTMQEAFPANSHRTRDEKTEEPEEKKVQRVVTGPVITRKKSFWRKLKDSFLGEDVGSVGAYIIYDVLIPAAKDTLEDLVKGSVEVLLRGETRGSRTRRDGSRSYVSYSNYYKSDDRSRRDSSYVNRARHDFSDIILKSRGEAEEVLSQLVDMVEDYGVASIADLYGMVGVSTSFTDNKYGWDNLSSASISRVRDGYMLDLPKAIPID
jgi:hypothetical protein